MEGYVHSIETFGAVDGPGIRYVIFVTGCNMRCAFCHNPDTWKMKDGELRDSGDLIKHALRYREYWGEKGGITVSGGEPLLQPDFVIDIFKKAHAEGVNTCLDTSGNPYLNSLSEEKMLEVMEVTDLVMLDIKQINEEKHKKLTGFSNDNILKLAGRLSDIGKPMWIRHVLVPGIDDNDEDLQKTREFIDSLKTVERVEVLPYHTLGVYKWKELGIPYRLEGVDPPDDETVNHARQILGAV
ncbi:MAG: pyruvate formate-lyase-activating protein [Lachnospiraceae bacterium]|jgi:pyruvate formate lyase activating enzyme|nr:pyruvate formate-lyase-activating protein [Lachnospiraceae bacterium]